jgi:hypothetical protein
MRGPLLPPTVPGWRSRAERFYMAVLEAYEPIERRWRSRVSTLDVAELAELLHEVLVAQVATFLGVEPSVIDPEMGDE